MGKSHRNCIRFNKHNSIEHEIAKAEICYLLLKNNKEFITECKLSDTGQMADIFITDNAFIIEILHSETEKEFNNKIIKYPSGINVIKMDSTSWIKDDLWFL